MLCHVYYPPQNRTVVVFLDEGSNKQNIKKDCLSEVCLKKDLMHTQDKWKMCGSITWKIYSVIIIIGILRTNIFNFLSSKKLMEFVVPPIKYERSRTIV